MPRIRGIFFGNYPSAVYHAANMKIKLLDLVDLWFRRRVQRGSRGRSGILLVSSGGLGDTILFSLMLPYFQELLLPNETMTLLTQQGRESLHFLLPAGIILETVQYRRFIRSPLYRWSVSRRLRKRQYRLAISTDHLRLPTVDDAFVIAAAAATSYALAPRSWPKHNKRLTDNQRFYTKQFPVSGGKAHRMLRWAVLVSGLLGREVLPPKVTFPSSVLPPPRVLAKATVVIHPFSAVKERQVLPSFYQALFTSIPASWAIVFSAAPQDIAANPEYDGLLRDSRVSVDTGSIAAKAALYRAAKCVIAVDTSMLHLAIGLGVPTIGLVSAAHLVDSVPYDDCICPDNVTFYYHSMSCEGCLGQCVHPLEKGQYACVAKLSPAAVCQQIEKFAS